jgi:O-antigen/teichoic acid export membrane protein
MRAYINKLRKSNSARNSGWIISERILSVGITTVVTILSARYLGVENYGILSYGLTITTLFMAVVKLGIDSIIVNELINNKSRQGEFLGTSIVLRFAASILSILSIGLLLFVMNSNEPLLITVAMVQSLLLIFQAAYVLDNWFQSQLKSKFVSIAKVSATVATASYSAYLLLSGKSVVWFAASTVLTGLVIAVVLYFFYRRQGGQKLLFSLSATKYLLSRSHHFILANVMILIYAQVNKVMLGNISGNAELGVYSAALMFCMAWTFLPESIITSMRPLIIHAKAKSNSLYLRRLKQLYFIVFWICVAIATMLALAAPLLVLLLGDEFRGSVAVLQIAVWSVPFAMLGVARSVWVVCEEKYRYPKYYLLCGVIVGVVANIIMIPLFGAIGAAISTVITEMVVCMVAPSLFKETRVHTKIALEAIIYKL